MIRDHRLLDDIDIAEYIEGGMDPERCGAMEEFFVRNAETWEEFISIKRAVAGDPAEKAGKVPESLIRKVVAMYQGKRDLFDIVVAVGRDFINVVKSSSDIKVFAPLVQCDLRTPDSGGPRMVVMSKSFDDIEVEVDIERVMDDLCNMKIIVVDIASRRLLKKLRVDLVSKGKELASDVLEQGMVTFEDIEPGEYRIKVGGHDKIFGELSLKIEGRNVSAGDDSA